jgi:hypothetical protein
LLALAHLHQRAVEARHDGVPAEQDHHGLSLRAGVLEDVAGLRAQPADQMHLDERAAEGFPPGAHLEHLLAPRRVHRHLLGAVALLLLLENLGTAIRVELLLLRRRLGGLRRRSLIAAVVAVGSDIHLSSAAGTPETTVCTPG